MFWRGGWFHRALGVLTVALIVLTTLTFSAARNPQGANASGVYHAELASDRYLWPSAPTEILRLYNVPAGVYHIDVEVLVGAALSWQTFTVRGGHDQDNEVGVLWGQGTTAGAGQLQTITLSTTEVWGGGDFVVQVMPDWNGTENQAKAKKLPNQGWGLYGGNATWVTMAAIP
jgi:hypothetical protein